MSDKDTFQMVRLNPEAEFYSAIDQVDIDITNRPGQNLLHEAVAFKNM